MKREIRRAREQGKFCYVALEKGLSLPERLPKGVEYDEFDALDQEAMACIAERIMQNDAAGTYRSRA